MFALLVAPLSLPNADLITKLPGFGDASSWPFDAYSGFLTVPGPFKLNSYDSLKIHYQFHTSQQDPTKDPLVTWHQGGPGGSSIDVGLYTEMGYFQQSDKGPYVNEFAWNKVSNMLYLESPAGSGQRSGFSECIKGGVAVECSWDDVSQAEAYAHSLAAFKKAFPEFASNDLYLTGESYFGQYGPNIANYILTHAPFNTTLGLRGIAAGNACWGGTEHEVLCNGANSVQNNVDMFFGKGLVSKKTYDAVYANCHFPGGSVSGRCSAFVQKAYNEVGPHNVYFIYDNCPNHMKILNETGNDMFWLHNKLVERLSPESANSNLLDADKTGGYDWSCDGMSTTEEWIKTAEVRAALHLPATGSGSGFNYHSSGPASVTLWPFLATKIRVLIYNGDSDACVPYKGNEEWIDNLEATGTIKQKDEWKPWYDAKSTRAPAGYVTTYTVPTAPNLDFSFVTIRLAGHMVPTFQPSASLTFYSRFLAAQPF